MVLTNTAPTNESELETTPWHDCHLSNGSKVLPVGIIHQVGIEARDKGDSIADGNRRFILDAVKEERLTS